MKDNGRKCFVQAYNAQMAVDAHAQVIVAAELTQQSVCATTGNKPKATIADAGYWDTASLHHPSLEGIQVLVSPDSQLEPAGTALPETAPQNAEAARMREFLASETGKALYASRKATVEPVFGQIKEARGIRRFRLRGLERVRCEWKFICATHNLLKLFRHRVALATV